MTLARGRAAAWLVPWLILLGTAPALAQGASVDAIVGDRPKPPFSSPEACLEFAQGSSAAAPAQPAARLICDRLDRVWQDPTGAKPAEGMYSWTRQILQDQIALTSRKAAADATADKVRVAHGKR